MLSDPDPMMRLANMESIVRSGDGVRIGIAIRTAFASDDPQLKGLAMRAYLATHKNLMFDIALPAALQAQYDSASPPAMQELFKLYPYSKRLSRAAFKLHFLITEYNFGDNDGAITSYDHDYRAVKFTVTGAKTASYLLVVDLDANCFVDFQAAKTLTLDGTLACQGEWPKLSISAPAF